MMFNKIPKILLVLISWGLTHDQPMPLFPTNPPLPVLDTIHVPKSPEPQPMDSLKESAIQDSVYPKTPEEFNLTDTIQDSMLFKDSLLLKNPEASYMDSSNLQTPHIYNFSKLLESMLIYNPDLSIAKAQWLASHEGVISAWGEFEPKFAGDYQRQESSPPLDGYHNWREEYKVGVTGSLPWTGTQYDIYSKYQGYSESSTTSSLFTGTTLKQPLARDFWYGSSMVNIHIAAAERDKAFQQYRSTLANYVDQLYTAYWEYAWSLKNLNAELESEHVAQKLRVDAKIRLAQGKTSPLEALRAESEYSLRQNRRIEAQKQVATSKSSLLLLVADPDLFTEQDFFVEARQDSLSLNKSISQPEVIDQYHPDFLAQNAEIQKQQHVIKYHKSQQLPSVILSGTMGVQATSENASLVFDRYKETGLRETVLGGGISVEIPIAGNIKGRYALKAEKHNLLIAERKLALIRFQINENIRILQEQKSQLETQLQQENRISQFHRDEWTAQIRKIQAGKSSLVDIYEIEEKWREAQKRYLETQKNLQITGVRLLRAQGILLKGMGLESRNAQGNIDLLNWLIKR